MPEDADLEPLLPAHLTFLRQRNQRPISIRERRRTVLRLAARLGHPVADVTRDELKAWQLDPGVNGRQIAPASVAVGIVHIAQYMRWLVVNQHRPDDPSVVLVRPQHVKQSLPRPMADDNVDRAIDTATDPIRTWVELGAFCGLRCMEIAGLDRRSIVPGPEPFLRIVGKGGKERTVSLPAPLAEHLLTGPFNPAGFLFSREDGRPGPPSPARVSARINAHLREQGIPETAHSLRHRFGTKLYQESTDMLLVADTMGHDSIETTRGYVRLMSNRASAAVNAIYRPRQTNG